MVNSYTSISEKSHKYILFNDTRHLVRVWRLQTVSAMLSEKDNPLGSDRSAIPTAKLSASGGTVFNALAEQEQSARDAVTDNVTSATAALAEMKNALQS